MGNNKHANARRNLRSRPRLRKLKTGAGFWQQPSLEALMEQQALKSNARLEQILGKGARLWDSDEDFDKFLSGIYERRQEIP